MKEIILNHYKKYPLMEVTDYVKLIYQSTFGGGHLIKDEETSLAYLKEEFNNCNKNSEDEFEDIGNGLVRVNLHSYKGNIEKLHNAFVLSSSMIHGTQSDFLKNLNDLISLTNQSKLGITISELNNYLKEYKEKGYPMVSHSKTFKDNYNPSYRVIMKSCLSKDMNVGFLGASKIGRKMARAISLIDGFKLYSVAARNINRANEYKEECGFEKAYGSYEEMLQDPNVDLVYLSTIHSVHYEQLLLCLKYHKPVLCEKSLTLSYEETKDIYERFEKENLYLAEALMISFLPARYIINDLLFKDKIIGDIKEVHTYFTADIKDVERVVKKELGGGAIYDIGIYSITEIFRLLGFDYDSMKLLDYVKDEVDLYEEIEFKYNDIVCTAMCDVRVTDMWNVIIKGSKGILEIDSISLPKHVTIKDLNNNVLNEIDLPSHHGGFRYELQASKDAILNNKYETKFWTHEDSVKTAKCIQEILKLMK